MKQKQKRSPRKAAPSVVPAASAPDPVAAAPAVAPHDAVAAAMRTGNLDLVAKVRAEVGL